jgi:hypothetical protein
MKAQHDLSAEDEKPRLVEGGLDASILCCAHVTAYSVRCAFAMGRAFDFGVRRRAVLFGWDLADFLSPCG